MLRLARRNLNNWVAEKKLSWPLETIEVLTKNPEEVRGL